MKYSILEINRLKYTKYTKKDFIENWVPYAHAEQWQEEKNWETFDEYAESFSVK